MKYFKYNDVIFYSFLVWILLSGGLQVDNSIFLIGNFVLFSLFVFGIVYKQYYVVKISKQYGKVLASYTDPKPFTSMINAISKAGYSAKDIKKIDFISYDLEQSCDYIKPILSKIVKVNSKININIIGYGDKDSCQSINSDSLIYFPIKKKLEEHKNLVYMNDNRVFLWYEPSHKIVDGSHYFKGGGYFLDPTKSVLEDIENYIQELKAS